MGFLAPWFLGGIAVAALPLWLHLLRRYRSEPQPFSSLMFFEPRTQSSVRHRRLLYLLMLAFRFKPFPGILFNFLFYLVPALITYLLTNFSFRRIYKKEKVFFFHLFKARRLKDDEIDRLGI